MNKTFKGPCEFGVETRQIVVANKQVMKDVKESITEMKTMMNCIKDSNKQMFNHMTDKMDKIEKINASKLERIEKRNLIILITFFSSLSIGTILFLVKYIFGVV